MYDSSCWIKNPQDMLSIGLFETKKPKQIQDQSI